MGVSELAHQIKVTFLSCPQSRVNDTISITYSIARALKVDRPIAIEIPSVYKRSLRIDISYHPPTIDLIDCFSSVEISFELLDAGKSHLLDCQLGDIITRALAIVFCISCMVDQ